MLCYKDKTFCCSQTHKPDCDKIFTKEDAEAAKKWWGNNDYPVAYSNFCDHKNCN